MNSEDGGRQQTGAELCFVMVGWMVRRRGCMEQIDCTEQKRLLET